MLVPAFLPALLLSNVLLSSVSAAGLSCMRVEFGAPGSPYGGCSIIAGELIVVVAVSWFVPLFVAATLLYLSGRSRGGTGEPVVVGTPSIGSRGAFVAATAVLMGVLNAFAIDDPFDAVAAPAERPTATVIATLILAVIAGLAASGIILKLERSALDGGFLARYGVTVLGLCLGGAILGGSSWVVDSLLNYQPGPSQGPESGVFFLAYATLAYGSIAALVGGVLGLLEGLVLGLPLATVLGRLRRPPRRTVPRDSSPNPA